MAEPCGDLQFQPVSGLDVWLSAQWIRQAELGYGETNVGLRSDKYPRPWIGLDRYATHAGGKAKEICCRYPQMTISGRDKDEVLEQLQALYASIL
jgi:hypothetical protein